MFADYLRQATRWSLLGAFLSVMVSACSSSPSPLSTPLATPPLVSLNTLAGEGFTFPGPATQITTSYAILKVTGSSDVTIKSITVNSQATDQAVANSSFEAIHDTGAASETYFLSAPSVATAKSIGIAAARSLTEAVPSQGPLAAWRTAPTAAGAVLHPGLYYVLTYSFTIPQPAAGWNLQSAMVIYSVSGGGPQTLVLNIPSVEISPSASPAAFTD
ncbi:MAG TPA: hypothetical protein VEK76_06055 [Candidatus Binatia bacterium]|nr:hypothetical protein [Candidatus Binatia bacterium]